MTRPRYRGVTDWNADTMKMTTGFADALGTLADVAGGISSVTVAPAVRRLLTSIEVPTIPNVYDDLNLEVNPRPASQQ